MKGLLLTVVVWVLVSPTVQGQTVPTVPATITRPNVTVPRVPNITSPSITNRRVTPPSVTIPSESTTTDVVKISEIDVTTTPTINIPRVTVPSSSVGFDIADFSKCPPLEDVKIVRGDMGKISDDCNKGRSPYRSASLFDMGGGEPGNEFPV